MTDAELLAKIKNGLGVTGTYQDNTLNVYIADVKAFMKSAGVLEAVVNSEASVGCILRGVADLWNYGSGNATLSEYFRMRLLQLKNVFVLSITQAQGTTVTVVRNGTTLSNETIINKNDVLTISVTGGTITVNGTAFTSGNTLTVTDNVIIVSTAAESGDE